MQTKTREALKEFDVFFQKFPNSALTPEVRKNWRIARDRLSDASYGVGLHYYRVKWYPGAIDRFREVLRDDPDTRAGTPFTSIWRSRWPDPIRHQKPSRTSNGCSRNFRAANTSRTPRSGFKR